MRSNDNGSGGDPGDRVTDVLNRSCHCINVDKRALRRTLETRLGETGAYSGLLETHPHLLADSPVFVSRERADQMREIIESIEHVASLETYQDLVLKWAPEVGRSGPKLPTSSLRVFQTQ